MALATSNRQGGTTSERGFQSAQGASLSGDVISGFRVRQAETPSMMVRIGGEFNESLVDDRGRLIDLSDNAIIRDGLKYHTVFTDDGQAVTANVDPAHASLPRKDLVILYIDRTVARAKTPVDNANGVVKVKVVAGVPASTPSDPTLTAIQSAISAGNPFIKVGRINVPNGASTIVQSMIEDLRMPACGTGISEAFRGDVSTRPDGTLVCDGSEVDIDKYSLLFRVIGHTYAFDPATGAAKTPSTGKFFLPDDRGRVYVQKNASDTDFSTLGKSGGVKSHTHPLSNNGAAKITLESNVVYIQRIGSPFTTNVKATGASTSTDGSTQTSAAGLQGNTDAAATLQPYMTVNNVIRF